MRSTTHPIYDAIMLSQIRWLMRSRWIAGGMVIVLSLIDLLWLRWHDHAPWMAALGCIILGYNVVLGDLLRKRRRLGMLRLAAAQIALDLACLTLLTLWTGGPRSPLLGFFVFHMILASLLLWRPLAYASAGAAVFMMSSGLWATRNWPQSRSEWIGLMAWAVMLGLTVYVVSGIARRLRRQSHRLVIQNRRMLGMAKVLGSQQKTIIQSERLVAMGQMAAGIAHEIANPLANLDSLLQLMGRNPSRLTAENMGKLSDQCERIRGTIQKMTQFAHPSPNEWRVVSLNDIAATGIGMVQFDPRRRSINIERQLMTGERHVRVQSQAMEQVMTNLLINALDAVAERPEPQVIVRTSAAGNRGCIEVIDNGPGISPELSQRVFDPFFTTKPVGKGTGLGLAICYRLIRNHGGEISVTPTPGRGATFRIELELLPVAGRALAENSLVMAGMDHS